MKTLAERISILMLDAENRDYAGLRADLANPNSGIFDPRRLALLKAKLHLQPEAMDTKETAIIVEADKALTVEQRELVDETAVFYRRAMREREIAELRPMTKPDYRDTGLSAAEIATVEGASGPTGLNFVNALHLIALSRGQRTLELASERLAASRKAQARLATVTQAQAGDLTADERATVEASRKVDAAKEERKRFADLAAAQAAAKRAAEEAEKAKAFEKEFLARARTAPPVRDAGPGSMGLGQAFLNGKPLN
ncbi:MAG: hypothetical protein IT462_12540 [Planctomycetes bacterium]|nr:hypothetical protein [Planctomycetota bacterium]